MGIKSNYLIIIDNFFILTYFNFIFQMDDIAAVAGFATLNENKKDILDSSGQYYKLLC